jgi:hypothetical protein
MIIVVKCRGQEVENMLLRRTRRSTHNNRGALVNVHDDAHTPLLVLDFHQIDRFPESKSFK